MPTFRLPLLVVLLLLSNSPLEAGSPAEDLLRKPAAWFHSDEGRKVLQCVLSWQTSHGDWPKNLDTTSEPFSATSAKPPGTFDNNATTGELRLLAKAFRITGDQRYRSAFLAGFDHIVIAQYDNGGWPQFYPLNKKYNRYITFNDWSMIRLMKFLQDCDQKNDFAWLDANRKRQARSAVELGIDCIVKCQVKVNGELTVWCAQHDEVTLAPVAARSFELASLSGAESAGILTFLMEIDNPTPEVIEAVNAGAAWFARSKIEGFRYVTIDGERGLINDSSDGPLWPRFYELETNRPIFAGRDGVKKYSLDQIERERRNGYAWYGTWGRDVAQAYANWPFRTR